MYSRWRTVLCTSPIAIGAYALFSMQSKKKENILMEEQYNSLKPIFKDITQFPTRSEHLTKLKNNINNKFDVLVIGGGATGTGIALDAITRGLNVALIESKDFSSGTSSRSTKLIHGGPRYLETAIKTLNLEQLHLVIESLSERSNFLHISPYLSSSIPIIVPIYNNYFNLIKYYIGFKIYDFIAYIYNGVISSSYYLSSEQTLQLYPLLKTDKLIGSIIYFDGYHNDSRTCLNIALTAISYGAITANHVECIDFIKDNAGKIIGVVVRDNLTNQEWNIYSKIVINATGCFIDRIRKFDNNNIDNLIVPSQGTHLILSQNITTTNATDDKLKRIGVLIPATSDGSGRIATITPFENTTIIGTTDVALNEVIDIAQPTKEEVDRLLFEINNYLSPSINVDDIQSIWSGIRPLVNVPIYYKQSIINNIPVIIQQSIANNDNKANDINVSNTSNISRKHIIEISFDSGLVTISGGKWTIYRRMAQDVLNVICGIDKDINKKSSRCITRLLKLFGSADLDMENLSKNQILNQLKNKGIDNVDIANHLYHNYGIQSLVIADIVKKDVNKYKLLIDGFPFTKAEIEYCSKYEYTYSVVSMLSHRTRLAQLDNVSAVNALTEIINIMSKVHKWDETRETYEYEDAMNFIHTCGLK